MVNVWLFCFQENTATRTFGAWTKAEKNPPPLDLVSIRYLVVRSSAQCISLFVCAAVSRTERRT